MITISKGVDSTLAYLTENLDEKHVIVYDKTLKILPATEIKTYVVTVLIRNLEKNIPGILKRLANYIWEGLIIQNIAITVGVVGVCFGGYKLISWLTNNNEALTKGAQITKKTVNAAGYYSKSNSKFCGNARNSGYNKRINKQKSVRVTRINNQARESNNTVAP
jgi:hypothetical protein